MQRKASPRFPRTSLLRAHLFTLRPPCLPLLKSSLQWLTFRGEQAAYYREEDGWETLISEGVGRAHHDSTMETAGAALAAAARLSTNTLGIRMQVASRCRGARYSILPCPTSLARLGEEEVAAVSLNVVVYCEGYFVPTILSNKRQSRKSLGFFFAWHK